MESRDLIFKKVAEMYMALINKLDFEEFSNQTA
jgi:hypothetical protein